VYCRLNQICMNLEPAVSIRPVVWRKRTNRNSGNVQQKKATRGINLDIQHDLLESGNDPGRAWLSGARPGPFSALAGHISDRCGSIFEMQFACMHCYTFKIRRAKLAARRQNFVELINLEGRRNSILRLHSEGRPPCAFNACSFNEQFSDIDVGWWILPCITSSLLLSPTTLFYCFHARQTRNLSLWFLTVSFKRLGLFLVSQHVHNKRTCVPYEFPPDPVPNIHTGLTAILSRNTPRKN
jgi:hypothetical protein